MIKGITLLPVLYQINRKRDIKNRQIKKWKARRNVDGSRMKNEVHYEKLYSPVSGWYLIRVLLIIVALKVWKTIQVDYVQDFTQSPIYKYLYIKVTTGFQVEDIDNDEYALKLHRNIYGQKQAGRAWYNYLT